jgi:hypothetical protein
MFFAAMSLSQRTTTLEKTMETVKLKQNPHDLLNRILNGTYTGRPSVSLLRSLSRETGVALDVKVRQAGNVRRVVKVSRLVA